MATVDVLVLDANNAVVRDAWVVLDAVPQPVEQSGMTTFSNVSTIATSHTIEVDAPFYTIETVEFHGSLETGEWNNALLSRTVLDDRVLLTMRLGRLDVAPTAGKKSEAEIRDMAARNIDARGVVLEELKSTPAGSPEPWTTYIGQQREPQGVYLTDGIILPPTKPGPDQKSWFKFNGHVADPPVDPLDEGRLFWLINGGSNRTKGTGQTTTFAIAVWAPNFDTATPVDALDMIVYFTPSTGGWAARYPFGMWLKTDPPPAIAMQQFMDLGVRYMFSQMGSVHQLVGRGRKAVIVMPINRYENRGPYVYGEGLFRLCREVALFLHRECQTSSLGRDSPDRVPDAQRHSGGSLRNINLPGIFATDFGVAPRVGRVAIAGFSEGIVCVKQVMSSKRWTLPEELKLPQRYWGSVGGAAADMLVEDGPQTEWQRCFREIWDLDGYHDETGGWDNYLSLIKTWAGSQSDPDPRMIRLFHSITDIAPNPLTSKHATWILLRDTEQVTHPESADPKKQVIPGVIEVHGARWTAVQMPWRSGYLDLFKTVDAQHPFPPLFRDYHHAVPKIAFGQFVELSPIGKTV